MQRIIFFDGICVLCNGFIKYLYKIDNQCLFKFAPLDSKASSQYLPYSNQGPGSVAYFENDKMYLRSTAVIRIFFALGGAYYFLALFMSIFPLFIRDGIYNFIARNRYRTFGKFETCPLVDDPKLRLDKDRLLD